MYEGFTERFPLAAPFRSAVRRRSSQPRLGSAPLTRSSQTGCPAMSR